LWTPCSCPSCFPGDARSSYINEALFSVVTHHAACIGVVSCFCALCFALRALCNPPIHPSTRLSIRPCGMRGAHAGAKGHCIHHLTRHIALPCACRFAAPMPRASTIRFSTHAVLARHPGPGNLWALSFRLANIRKHSLLEPEVCSVLLLCGVCVCGVGVGWGYISSPIGAPMSQPQRTCSTAQIQSIKSCKASSSPYQASQSASRRHRVAKCQIM
jgi:hypothetical protein